MEGQTGTASVRTYKLRTTGHRGRTVEVSVPPEHIEKLARKYGLTTPQFVGRFIAVAHFNGSDQLIYTFHDTEEWSINASIPNSPS